MWLCPGSSPGQLPRPASRESSAMQREAAHALPWLWVREGQTQQLMRWTLNELAKACPSSAGLSHTHTQ